MMKEHENSELVDSEQMQKVEIREEKGVDGWVASPGSCSRMQEALRPIV